MPLSKHSLVLYALIACCVGGCAAVPPGGNSAPGTDREAAGAPPLQGTEWVVVDIDGAGVVDRSRATLNFAPDGRLSGNASCNTFRASYAVAGDTLTIAQAITTRMACPEALMQQEARLLAALAGVRTFAISPDGGLSLRSAAGVSVRARRASGANEAPR